MRRVVLVGCLWAIPSVAVAGFTPLSADEGPASFGANGAVFADLDEDGHVDFLRRGTAEIWLGNGDGTFTLGGECGTNGPPTVADFDNDGHLDILRVNDQPVLCLGHGDGTFEESPDAVEINPSAGMDSEGDACHMAAAADLDNDGWLDLYMTNYEGPNFTWYRDVVYFNDGTGRLEVDHEIDGKYPGRNVIATDFEGDGDQDIYVSNYRLVQNYLWQNDGTGALENVAGPGGATGGASHTISSAFGDLDNDLDLDIFVGNFAHPGQPTIKILRNDISDQGPFVDIGSGGIHWQESYAGVALADYDNDGDLDAFITTVYQGDFGRLFRNDQAGGFVDVTVDEGLDGQHEGYGVSWADVNEDGALDLYLGGKQDDHLYLGEPNGNHWLSIGLSAAGSETVNNAAIGARVYVHTGENSYLRELQSGGTAGERGSNSLRVHFGLGEYSGPLEIEVRWPAGLTCFYPAESDTRVDLLYSTDCDQEGMGGDDETGDGGEETDGGGDETTDEGGDDGTGESETGDDVSADDGNAGTGCGCSQSAGGSPWAIGLGLPLLAWRRRRGVFL